MADAADQLRRGRDSYARRAWNDAFESLSLADEDALLEAEDLERLATAAYMLGREDAWLATLERIHQVHVGADERLPAARSAFWIGMQLALRGEVSRASGWLGRAQRLVEAEGPDTVERGYLLLPATFRLEGSGDFSAAAATAAEAAEVARRFGDADLFALAVHRQGWMLIKDRRIEEGLALLDEAMVSVTTGEPSPIVTGLVYCAVILACQEAYELRRAQEWTAALTSWCAEQPDLVSFTGRCLIHRAEIMQMHGSWSEALEEARLAGRRLVEAANQPAAGMAWYRQGELHRLQGDFADAEAAYRAASGHGWEPQPGLALLRLAEGRSDAAAAAIRRVVGETTELLKRGGLLPAYVEIMLAIGEVDDAREACRELEEITRGYQSEMLGAMVTQSRGAVELAAGDAETALRWLRRAWHAWQELEAPYEAARLRLLVGLACRALGDEDTAALELEAARDAFQKLGAAPDLARADALAVRAHSQDRQGLTQRELEVLRFVSAGRTNKEIAAELVISEHTVARHVQNIFAKLRVSSRAAATAFAFEHELL